ncbi:translation initiation factor eIF4A [Hymenolepis weldensis]
MSDNVNDNGEIETNYFDAVGSFDDLGLKDEVLRGIYQYGFERPSAIQQRAILPCLLGRDVIAQAQSGTGKTATFTISILQRIDPTVSQCQALVLAPTRELAKQIQTVIQRIGQNLEINCHLCIGGTILSDDINVLCRGAHVVVGTPGRVLDMMNRRYLCTDRIIMFVLDEADEMLSRGFEDQIKEIYGHLPDFSQIVLLSATMPPEIFGIINQMIKDPVKILVKKEDLTLDGIRQFFVNVQSEQYKFDTLMDLYKLMDLGQVVIFVNTVKKAIYLADSLVLKDFQVSCIHGDMKQCERDAIMSQFRGGSTRVLVSTDVLARGIDVQQVSLVLNYDVPTRREVYIHRIGRSGRFGRKGVAINFVTEEDKATIDQLAKYYSTSIMEMPSNIMDLL